MIKPKVLIICATVVLAGGARSQAALITFDDVELGNAAAAFSYSEAGFTLNVTASNGGALATISSGMFAGLHIPGFAPITFGTYTFSFSEPVDSIEIQFDALSSIGGGDPETITNFMTSFGPIAISYTNLGGTTFDGTTITSTANDGRGLIVGVNGPFNFFSFDHAQNSSQNGFVIERITVDTVDVSTPEPSSIGLLALAILGLGSVRARRTR